MKKFFRIEKKYSFEINDLRAEILYKYITNTPDFIESHTGLEDVMIEYKIFVHCCRQHKKMEKLPKGWKR